MASDSAGGPRCQPGAAAAAGAPPALEPLPLVLFARLPVPGRAKTRLAAGVGAEGAAGFYKACAEHAFAQALRCAGASRINVLACSACYPLPRNL